MRDQLSAERSALREAGDLAAELGVTIAVETTIRSSRSCAARSTTTRSGLPSWRSRSPGSTIPRSASAWMRCMRPRGSRLRLRLYRGVHRPGTTRAPRTPSRQPAEDQPYGRARRLRSTPCTGWEICTSAGQGHHPARGPVAADELSRKPSCCVELSPELFPLVPEALGATRELILKAASRERVSA